MRFLTLTLCLLLALSWSCRPNDPGATENVADPAYPLEGDSDEVGVQEENADILEPVPPQVASADFVANLRNLVPPYLALKDALVEGNVPAARAAGNQLTAAIAAVDDMPVTDNSRDYWEDRARALTVAVSSLNETEDLERMRMAFADITQPMWTVLSAYQANSDDIYLQYCPMAMDNTGAYWLSAEEEIRNPYFGDKMLRCGSVKKELAAAE